MLGNNVIEEVNNHINIVNIVTVGTGGAYRAVERLNEALNKESTIDSNILLRNKVYPDNSGIEFLDTPMKTVISKAKNFINIGFSSGEITRDLLGSDVTKHPAVKNADVIVVHWINSFLTTKIINKICDMGKPVVLFLHDMWHFTGGCHSDGYCGGYKNGCKDCPLEKKTKQVAHKNFLDKLRDYENLKVVAPSLEYMKLAKESPIFANNDVICINNTIDTNVFRPIDIDKSSLSGKLLSNVPVVLFTADTAGKANKNKGFDLLLEALKTFDEDEIQLLILGNIDEEDLVDINVKYNCLGYLHDENRLVEAYNVADVTVVPSLQESFCFSACESMACGTPVVAFPVGGIKDQIDHKENGYLAKFKDSKDLAMGIRYCIESKERLKNSAVSKAQSFSHSMISTKWREYLNEICN